MRIVYSVLNLFFILCFLLVSGCAATKETVSTRSYSKGTILLVTSEQLQMRACPSLNCKVTAVLKRGDEMIKLGEEYEWIKIRVKTINHEGWVASRFVRKKAKITEEWSPHEKDKQGSSKLKEGFSP